MKFVETAHVKDLTAFLRLAENPRDLMAGTRVLMLLPGVGPKRARNLMDRLTGPTPTTGGAPGLAAWRELPPPSPATADLWPDLQTLMDRIGGPQPGDLATQIGLIRRFYAPLLERLYDNAPARLLDLERLEALATRFPDRTRFLAEMVLDPPAYTEDLAGPPLLDEDFLILSTIHSAKGLEWDAVYVIHAADGNIPSDMATGSVEEIEEELRLFYVALTRAKDWLYVCHPLRYYTHPHTFRDNHGYAPLTRFLSRDVLRRFEQQQAVEHPAPGAGDAESAGDDRFGEPVSTEDIRRRLKGLF